MTGPGKALVWLGGFLLAAAITVLGFSDTAWFETCETVATYERSTSATAGSPEPNADGNEQRPMVEVERVETCSPSDLKGGLPLVLAALGGLLISPGLFRVLPRGRYEAGPVAVDITPMGHEAAEQAEAAAQQLSETDPSTTRP